MPSIPQSLLWISLVVLWLFVLVPMLINKRDTVRRTSDVALATRVLNGGAKSRLIKKRGPAAGHRHDPDWQPAAEENPDHVDEADEFAEQQEVIRVYDDAVREARSGSTRTRTMVVVAAMSETTASELDYLDVDVVEEDSGALPVGGAAVQAGPAEEPAPLRQQEQAQPEPVAMATPQVVVEPQAVEVVIEPQAVAEPQVGPEPQVVAEPQVAAAPPAVTQPAARTRAQGTEPPTEPAVADDYDYIEDESGLEEEGPRIGAPSLSASRQRRMENTTAAAVEARKYRFRKRVLSVLTAVLLLTAGLSLVADASLWWACGVVGGVTVVYLGYLRRQTRIEAQVRRRRQQRQARVRPFVDQTAPPSRQEVDVNEFPTRLRRPGAVVLEIDDEDPVFEHLEEMAYSGSRYRPTHGPTVLRSASGL
jgi:hypothetical protein